MPGCLNVAELDPRFRARVLLTTKSARSPRHEQCVRLRRHQLQPDLRLAPMIERYFVQGCIGLGSWTAGLGGTAARCCAGQQTVRMSEKRLRLRPAFCPPTSTTPRGAAVRLALTIAQQAQ